MGLDVTAYRNVRIVDCNFDDDGCPVDENGKYNGSVVVPFINGDFPGREDGLEEGKAYAFDEEYSFRAGSYSTYSSFRCDLEVLADWPDDEFPSEDWPLFQLIAFSDCDGTLGPVVCKKLYQDMLSLKDKAQAMYDAQFVYKFNNWLKAFELASDNGMVIFN